MPVDVVFQYSIEIFLSLISAMYSVATALMFQYSIEIFGKWIWASSLLSAMTAAFQYSIEIFLEGKLLIIVRETIEVSIFY